MRVLLQDWGFRASIRGDFSAIRRADRSEIEWQADWRQAPGIAALRRPPRSALGAWAMPFKSKAQRRKFAELLVEGKISPETYEEWNRETGRKELPERVGPTKKKAPGKRRTPSSKKPPGKKA